MLDLAGGTTVYLACGATDLRKSYNGLAAVIKLKFQLDPYSRCMFAFCNRKYVNGMPLARQEREFARYNLNLSTKTMANWIIGCADRYLKPLYDRMKEEFLKSRYIHCDETRIQVIGEPDQKGSTQNWMWIYLTDEYSGAPRMALFDYERTRAGYHLVKFLDGRFHGYLTYDGYQAYHGLDDSITVTGCSHGRTTCRKSSGQKLRDNLSHLFCQVAFLKNQGTSDYLLTILWRRSGGFNTWRLVVYCIYLDNCTLSLQAVATFFDMYKGRNMLRY